MTAPYVTVKVETPMGVQVHARQQGALLPEGVLQESIAHHLRKKMIERVEVAEGEPEPEREPVLTREQWEQLAAREPGADPDSAPDVPPFNEGGTPPSGASVVANTTDQGHPVVPQSTPEPPEPAAPPESGPGSGKPAWVEYAVAQGMDRDEAKAMPRDDLIAALRKE